MEQYTVKAGDSVTRIARKFGVPLHLLLEVNRINDPNRIRVGQTLQIPSMTTDTREHPAPAPAPPAPAAEPLAINRDRFRLPPSQYLREETEKDLVMLHFTAGSNAQGAFSSWMSTVERVATAYILDRDGTVYELFDPVFWAFHLGLKGAASANGRHERRSIGIEIVNVGPLRARGEKLCWWPSDFQTTWCRLNEAAQFTRASYRGFDHYATYTETQLKSLGPLVRHLCERFSIPARLPPATQRDVADPTGFFRTFTGIASHQNYRPDKFDVGPAFDWSRLGL